MPGPAYEGPQYGGPDAQYGSYQGQNVQYAGPSQPHPDLARQYAPGTGGRGQRGGRRGRTIALIIIAILVAAAIGAGAALALRHHNSSGSGSSAGNTGNVVTTKTAFGSVNALNNPSSTVPAGWTVEKVQPSDANTTAGFSIDVPPGWGVQHGGKATHFTGPKGLFMNIDLTAHTYSDMVAEATYIERQSMPSHPGYTRVHLQGVPIRGTHGAFWQYTWTPAGSVKLLADDILFIKPTPAGTQSYAIEIKGYNSGWGQRWLPMFKQILSTFQTVPA
jgi:hypothetical protein